MKSNTIRFSTLSPDGNGGAVETNVQMLKYSDLAQCPHCIFVADHYRADGTCRCNDKSHTEMKGGLWA